MNELTQKSRLVTLLKLDSWPAAERAVFLEKSGHLLLEASIGRLLLLLQEAELAQLELYLDSHENIDDMVGYLSDRYPLFVDILSEEAVALEKEAEQTFSSTS